MGFVLVVYCDGSFHFEPVKDGAVSREEMSKLVDGRAEPAYACPGRELAKLAPYLSNTHNDFIVFHDADGFRKPDHNPTWRNPKTNEFLLGPVVFAGLIRNLHSFDVVPLEERTIAEFRANLREHGFIENVLDEVDYRIDLPFFDGGKVGVA